MNFSLLELLDYCEEEQARWAQWFGRNGDAPLGIALAGELHKTVGELILHVMGTELWYSERLREAPLTEWWTAPPCDAAGLLALGTRAKCSLREFIESVPEDGWAREIRLEGRGMVLRISVRKAVINALVHEIRHWAQAAIVMREHGLTPPGDADIVFSRALS